MSSKKTHMGDELGLVYFEEGSYSRGPVTIPVGEMSESNYYLTPTFSFNKAMENQGGYNRQRTLVFADLEIEGRRVECPRCHVPFIPHLGNLIAPFQCGNCRANLSYKTNSGRTVRCPCCNFSRPMPELSTLVCRGCGVKVIYKDGDRAVQCSLCKHITTRPIVSPQVNRVVPPDVNRVPPAQVNQVVSPSEVNRVVSPPEVNRVVIPLQINRRSRTATETTASSSYTPKPESSHTTIESIADSVAESVAQIVRNAVLAIGRVKREAEEDNTEAKNKKIRLD